MTILGNVIIRKFTERNIFVHLVDSKDNEIDRYESTVSGGR